MHRFFIKPENIKKDKIILSKEDIVYIKRVLRHKKGDKIKVLDGKGGEYLVEIEEMSQSAGRGSILERNFRDEPAPLSIIIGQGIPKAKKMDLVIQKATELGVDTIVPLITERTVLRLDDESSKRRVERWKKIAKGSSQQCKRSLIPEVFDVLDLDHFLLRYKGVDEKLILFEEESHRRLRDRLGNLQKVKRLALLIGPEGGFSRGEIDKAQDKGFIPVGLGPLILRTETAPLAALSIIQYLLGNLG